MAAAVPRLACALVVSLVVSLAAVGCAEDTVRLSFRPPPGQQAAYRITVRAVTVTDIEGQEPRRTVSDTVLHARHRVLESGPDGGRVEVRLRAADGPATTFVVEVDRAAQLTEVQTVETLPAGALGDLGLSEIFPAAAAAPPDRPLAPGAQWSIDEPVRVGAAPSRLAGEGRLVRLQVADGRSLAHVASDYRLPVQRTAEETGGRVELTGSQATTATVAYDVDDGAVHSARARTSGRYQVRLLPPPGVTGAPVPGSLVVDVDSTTRRVD